jgi:hypothetical protein
MLIRWVKKLVLGENMLFERFTNFAFDNRVFHVRK